MRARDTNQRLSSTPYGIGRCVSCRTLALLDVPRDLSLHYPPTYNDRRTDVDPDPHPEMYKLEITERWAPRRPCTILEIGPGAGGFVGLAVRAGHRVTVIDADAPSVTRLRQRHGVEGVAGVDPLPLLQGMGSFDVIALWHSLEHIPHAGDLLAEIPAHLTPGGVVIIATPNPEALQFKVLRGIWTHVDAPRHVFLAPARSLAAALRRQGLEVVATTYTDPGSVGWNRFGWQISLRNLSARPGVCWALIKAGRVISEVLGPIERSGARGSAYTVVASRTECAS